jgi:hypothetical protein
MTPQQRKVMELALEALEKTAYVNAMDYEYQAWAREALTAIKEALAQPEQEHDLSEQGRNRSAVLGNNIEAMMESGLSFLKALETTLKVYDHAVQKPPTT